MDIKLDCVFVLMNIWHTVVGLLVGIDKKWNWPQEGAVQLEGKDGFQDIIYVGEGTMSASSTVKQLNS